MKSKLSRFLPAAALLCIAFASCKKNDQSIPQPSSQATTASMLLSANNTITNGGSQQMEAVSDVVGSSIVMAGDSSDCRMVTFSPSRTMYPHLKTVDFGTGCAGIDGRFRSGKKLITVYADWQTAPAGTLISQTTFSDFYVDSVNVSGNVKVYIDTAASPGPLALKIVANKTFTDSKGNTSTFISTDYCLQTAGSATTTKEDNVYQITGGATGTEVLDGSLAVSWTSTIDPSDPVIKMGDCMYRSKGGLIIQLTLEGSSVFNEYLNYGDGTCDNNATITINNGTPQQVTLPLYFWPLSL
ncbi:MAG: hypothetical protein ABJB05_13800 [Parafilimonas sp.]